VIPKWVHVAVSIEVGARTKRRAGTFARDEHARNAFIVCVDVAVVVEIGCDLFEQGGPDPNFAIHASV
jgi:hypothetical protein